MSCHYSCLTCSSPTYPNACLSCPTTRTLIDSFCFCTSFSETQAPTCTEISSSFLTVLDVLYIAAIILSILNPLLVLCRLTSIKVKKLIDYSQLVGLLQYFPFRQSQLTSRAFTVLNAFNFNYLDISCDHKCVSYQYLIGVCLTVPLFITILLISYLITKQLIMGRQSQVVIRDGDEHYEGEEDIPFKKHLSISFHSFLLLYVQQTVIHHSMAFINLIVYSSNWWIVMLIYSLGILSLLLKQLHIINSPMQTSIIYRATQHYLFLYDQEYPSKYIHHLYRTIENSSTKKQQKQQQSPYYPQSNLLLIELLLKLILSCGTMALYTYTPALFFLTTDTFLLIYICSMGIFFIYQRTELALYLFLICLHMFLAVISTISFFQMAMVVTTIVFMVMILTYLLIVLLIEKTDIALAIKVYSKHIMQVFPVESEASLIDVKIDGVQAGNPRDSIFNIIQNTDSQDPKGKFVPVNRK